MTNRLRILLVAGFTASAAMANHYQCIGTIFGNYIPPSPDIVEAKRLNDTYRNRSVTYTENRGGTLNYTTAKVKIVGAARWQTPVNGQRGIQVHEVLMERPDGTTYTIDITPDDLKRLTGVSQ